MILNECSLPTTSFTVSLPTKQISKLLSILISCLIMESSQTVELRRFGEEVYVSRDYIIKVFKFIVIREAGGKQL